MSDYWKHDLSKSADAFLNIVWPAIASDLGGGEVVPVEAVTAVGMVKDFDIYGGVDAWQVTRNESRMRGIASRVQWVSNKPYNSFTIRKSRTSGAPTEFEKRCDAMKNIRQGWLFPGITIQAYIQSGTNTLYSVAAVHTFLLWKTVLTGTEGQDYIIQTNKQDGNTFLVVYWDRLASLNRLITRVDCGLKAA